MSIYDDLVDRNEIAHLLGVGPTAVSNYVARTSEKHPPFPEPVVIRGLGRFRLWQLEDVMDWFRTAFSERDAEIHWNEADSRLDSFRREHS
jgi:hypothetical protein